MNARTVRLATECLSLYLVAPLATTALLNAGVLQNRDMPLAFFVLFLIALALLARTPGFRWRALRPRSPLPDWKLLALYILISLPSLYLLTIWLIPGGLFGFPRHSPDLWMRVMLLYPLLSVLPQSIIYRALFFARYGPLFPSPVVAVLANAAAFALAHLFFQNWIAVGLCAVGGVAFGWVHGQRGSYWSANLLHVISGWTVFTLGLGRYFYHGAV